MALGFAISLAVFFWALKNGQFKDQKRARFLPLEDEHEPSSAKISTFHRYETYALVLLALAGLAASGAVLIFSLLNANGA
jgi:cbb3-type cytochrome oxidase maturation protein